MSGCVAAVWPRTAGTLGGDEVEHVVLPTRIGEEPREVSHALEVAHVDRVSVEAHRPVVTLPTERRWSSRSAARRRASSSGGVTSGVTVGAAWIPSRIVRAAWRLQHGPVLAAVGAMGIGEVEAGDRRLVRGADLVPESHRFGQRLFGAGRVAIGEPHPSASEGGAGHERLALESGGDDLQLVGGRAGPVDVAGCDLDLDLRLEQRRALQVGVRWALLGRHPQGVIEGVSDGGGRGGHVASSQLHQREARLGIPPGVVSREECFLRAHDVCSCGAGSVRARSTATPARAACRGAARRRPRALDSRPRGTSRAT